MRKYVTLEIRNELGIAEGPLAQAVQKLAEEALIMDGEKDMEDIKDYTVTYTLRIRIFEPVPGIERRNK